jgi:hypothetical protein
MGKLFEISDLDKPVHVELKGFGQELSKPEASRFFSGGGFEAIKQAIPQSFGDEIQFVSKGDWSLWELVDYLLAENTGCTIYMATWTISELSSRKLAEWIESGRIAKLYAVVDHRTKMRHESAYHMFAGHATNFKATRCHAKVTVIEYQGGYYSIIGSSNWTENPRIEVGMIRTDQATALLHKNWIIEEIQNELN